jgi:hypothetical protein
MNGVRRQRGWAFVVILIALAVVAFLARDSLSRMFATVRDGAATSGSRLPPAAVAPDAATTTPLPSATPLERARAVDGFVQDRAFERARQVDGQAR